MAGWSPCRVSGGRSAQAGSTPPVFCGLVCRAVAGIARRMRGGMGRGGRRPLPYWARAVALAAVGMVVCCASMWCDGPVSLVGGAGQVYGRLSDMNRRLSKENDELHKLLQQDETANMHVETGLEAQLMKERARHSAIRDREDQLSRQFGGQSVGIGGGKSHVQQLLFSGGTQRQEAGGSGGDSSSVEVCMSHPVLPRTHHFPRRAPHITARLSGLSLLCPTPPPPPPNAPPRHRRLSPLPLADLPRHPQSLLDSARRQARTQLGETGGVGITLPRLEEAEKLLPSSTSAVLATQRRGRHGEGRGRGGARERRRLVRGERRQYHRYLEKCAPS